MVGPSTLREEGWKVGDTVSVDDGGSLEIVGEGLMPQTPHSAFDQGLWVTVDESNTRVEEAEQADREIRRNGRNRKDWNADLPRTP